MDTSDYIVENIAYADIWVDPDFNSRKNVTPDSVEGLSHDIESVGRIIIPLIVQPAEEILGVPPGYKYMLICGFRRKLASEFWLGYNSAPCNIVSGLNITSRQAMNVRENLERKQYNIYEEALIVTTNYPPYKKTKDIAEAMSRPVSWVNLRRRFFGLPGWVQDQAKDGKFTETEIRKILQAGDQMDKVAQEIARRRRLGAKAKPTEARDSPIRKAPTKAEIKEVIVDLYNQDISIYFLRAIAYGIGEATEAELRAAAAMFKNEDQPHGDQGTT